MSAWGSFAREGAPRLPNKIDWPRYEASQPAFMTLDSGDALALSDDVPPLATLLDRVASSQVVSELERCLLVWELLTAVGTPDYDAYSAWESGQCAAIDAPTGTARDPRSTRGGIWQRVLPRISGHDSEQDVCRGGSLCHCHCRWIG